LAAFNYEGTYKKPKREIAKREIRRLIVEEGLTNNQISEWLNIPLRSTERYISEIYGQDNQLLQSLNSNQDMLTAWSIVRDRMDHHRQEILQNIARNPKVPFRDRLKAWNLICELEAADLRIRNETAPMVARRSASEVKRAMMVKRKEWEEEQENENISTDISQHSKNPQQQEDEGYDELEE
jgi:uncharacterized protein (UPF0147 family)